MYQPLSLAIFKYSLDADERDVVAGMEQGEMQLDCERASQHKFVRFFQAIKYKYARVQIDKREVILIDWCFCMLISLKLRKSIFSSSDVLKLRDILSFLSFECTQEYCKDYDIFWKMIFVALCNVFTVHLKLNCPLLDLSSTISHILDVPQFLSTNKILVKHRSSVLNIILQFLRGIAMRKPKELRLHLPRFRKFLMCCISTIEDNVASNDVAILLAALPFCLGYNRVDSSRYLHNLHAISHSLRPEYTKDTIEFGLEHIENVFFDLSCANDKGEDVFRRNISVSAVMYRHLIRIFCRVQALFFTECVRIWPNKSMLMWIVPSSAKMLMRTVGLFVQGIKPFTSSNSPEKFKALGHKNVCHPDSVSLKIALSSYMWRSLHMSSFSMGKHLKFIFAMKIVGSLLIHDKIMYRAAWDSASSISSIFAVLNTSVESFNRFVLCVEPYIRAFVRVTLNCIASSDSISPGRHVLAPRDIESCFRMMRDFSSVGIITHYSLLECRVLCREILLHSLKYSPQKFPEFKLSLLSSAEEFLLEYFSNDNIGVHDRTWTHASVGMQLRCFNDQVIYLCRTNLKSHYLRENLNLVNSDESRKLVENSELERSPFLVSEEAYSLPLIFDDS